MNRRNFFAELKRRNIYKVAIADAVVGWYWSRCHASLFIFRNPQLDSAARCIA